MRITRIASRTVRYGFLTIALATTTALSAATTMRVALLAQEDQVPSLIGQELQGATAAAERHGFEVRIEGKRHHPSISAQRIARQDPQPGSTLKRERTIKAWLSLGPKRHEVPSVEGESLRAARLKLDQTALPISRVIEVDHDTAEGGVVLQRPGAGDVIGLGEGVALLVSRGPGYSYVMPDLIGRSWDGVSGQLTRAGLKLVSVRRLDYPGVARGLVVRQQPAAGSRVRRNTAITIGISGAHS